MNISNLPEQAETTVKKTELVTKLRLQNYREILELGTTHCLTTVGKSYIWLGCRGSWVYIDHWGKPDTEGISNYKCGGWELYRTSAISELIK